MKRLLALLGALMLFLTIPGLAQASPSILDKTFSDNGVARSPLLSNSFPTSVQVDAQDRVLVGGLDANLGEGLVLRYKANGALDPTWGKRYLPLSAGGVIGLAVVGTKTLVGFNQSCCYGSVARLNPNGSLDTTFGTDGVMELNLVLTDMTVDAAGATIAVGTDGSGNVSLAKVSPDGRRVRITPICLGGRKRCGTPLALTVSPSNIFVGGSAPVGDTESAVVGRFSDAGVLDKTYGRNGYTWLNPVPNNDDSYVTDVAVVPGSGKVTAVGYACYDYCYHDSSFVLRYTRAGERDPSFTGYVYFGDDSGSGGTDSYPYGVALQGGKVVIVGRDAYCDDGAYHACFGVARLTATGARDTSFAGTGYTHTHLAPVGASDVRVFNDKIVVVGGQYVARFLG